MAHNANKVFINPNFKRPMDLHQTKQSNLMYVNPNFPKHSETSQMPRIETGGSKIFINPNFIKIQNVICKEQSHTPLTNLLPNSSHVITNQSKNTVFSDMKSSSLPLSIPLAKSRYSIIRNKNENKILKSQHEQRTSTVQINKYKSVNIQDVKRKLQIVNVAPKTLSLINKNNVTAVNTKIMISKYKKILVTKPSNLFHNKHKLVKINIPKSRNMKLSTSCAERDKIRRSFKKNNIPCPQFRKFGKCLRFLHGNCDYLHDKKHVSICRKFLSGVCHNKDCLLSHELSSKKMPTCYFYLKGMCTKDVCPYLHVKLNEKSKVCLDFLKGYCEKGNYCLNKHINLCPNVANNGTCIKKKCPYPHKGKRDSKLIVKKVMIEQKKDSTKVERASKTKEEIKGQRTNLTECRYYSESVNDGSGPSNENSIKPTRCKLGDLPSFIKF